MEQVISQVALYGLLALAGVGVVLALPRRGVSPQPVGAVIAAAGAGLIVLLMTLKAWAHVPNLYFYVFSAVALGASLRVITHPRPVYSALYFVLTILASAGLYLILSAEFMAVALVIVYAGAILITYLFVIMLATQAPTEAETEKVPEYDALSREPVAATAAGFILLAVLTTMLFRGVPSLTAPTVPGDQGILAQMPGKIERSLRQAGLIEAGDKLVIDPATQSAMVDEGARTVLVSSGGPQKTVPLPDDLVVTNVEAVGFNLLADHPGLIEIAGVILLMAMLGAVVLARRQVEMDEEAKAAQADKLRTLAPPVSGGESLGSGGGAA